jgi:uncharacterized protein YecE (DUF72 family)
MNLAGPRNTLIGTAGWSIPREHAHLFDEGESTLARYATRFNLVEVNSSFYRPHKRKTWERWAASVPRGFRFTAKLPKEITHDRALRGCAALVDDFLGQVTGLGNKLACVLVQLPPSHVLQARTATAFFAQFRRRYSGGIACEPRHVSWFTERADALFEHFDIARVAADPALSPAAATPGASGSARYWRWHGTPRMYYSDYPEAALSSLARQVQARAPAGTARLVVFDNTAHGHAIANAARLQSILAREGVAS